MTLSVSSTSPILLCDDCGKLVHNVARCQHCACMLCPTCRERGVCDGCFYDKEGTGRYPDEEAKP